MAPLILSIVLGGCQNHKSYVWLDSPINKEWVDRTIASMDARPDLDVFHISSGGGDSEQGIRLGKYLISRNIEVIVVGACYSACANYVFLPAKRRGVLPWAKIGMHGGYRSYLGQAVEHLNEVLPSFKKIYASSLKESLTQSDTETQMLVAAGIRPEIIEKSAQETIFGQIAFLADPDTQRKDFVIEQKRNTDFELWFPKPENYADWGIKIESIDPSLLPPEALDKFASFSDSFVISDSP